MLLKHLTIAPHARLAVALFVTLGGLLVIIAAVRPEMMPMGMPMAAVRSLIVGFGL